MYIFIYNIYIYKHFYHTYVYFLSTFSTNIVSSKLRFLLLFLFGTDLWLTVKISFKIKSDIYLMLCFTKTNIERLYRINKIS